MTDKSRSYNGTTVVIPTRNRAAIARNAIRSVLDQAPENVNVIVSDNSTSEEERAALYAFCSTLSDARLRYVRPPQSFSMSAHWEWVLHEALRHYSVTHFLYLTDRMMFKKGALKEVLSLAILYPEKVITYNHDRIIDDATPLRVEQYPATEKLLEVNPVHFSWLLSQSVFHNGLPRMLNCIVPRAVLTRIHQRFGSVFSSIAPDFVFCCRCLDMEDSILFYDKSPIFHYALTRSNGASVTRGEMTADNADFTANLPVDNSVRNYATPVPQLITAVNAAFNEYFLFKQTTNSPRFFEVDMQKYLAANANEIMNVTDRSLREQMISLLVAQGYREGGPNGNGDAATVPIAQRIQLRIKRLVSGPLTKQAWLFANQTLGVRPPGDNRFEFASLDEAIDYLENISPGFLSRESIQETLLMARQVPNQ